MSEIQAWCIRQPVHQKTRKKSESNQHLLKESFHQLQSQFIDYQYIYTDISKDENKHTISEMKTIIYFWVPSHIGMYMAMIKLIRVQKHR